MADPQPDDKLSVRQHKALNALMVEPSVSRAALACEVPERTLRAWLKWPAFADEYRAARREATQQAIARLQQASGAAVNVLLTIMTRDTSPAVVRLNAARTVLELAIKAVELEDLAARLDALERICSEECLGGVWRH
jgi:hypothetical protein